ncbi:MAG: outer membrane lipoprotein chaperone LolA [Burkholderiales bacterium]|jgi:outer membrane lipoprotein carrier protein
MPSAPVSSVARRRVLATVAVAVAAGVAVPRPAAAAAIDQLREFATATKSARGQFTQQQVRTTGRAGEASAGTFSFSRPGRFRWEVVMPYEQLIVTDGERLHFYDKDLKQVTVRKVGDAISATPAAILFGSNDLDASFVLKEVGSVAGIEWLEATPKQKDSGFDWIRIGLRGGLPEAMEVRDAFGQTTRFTFSKIERNPALDPSTFRFTAPKGVDVVQ